MTPRGAHGLRERLAALLLWALCSLAACSAAVAQPATPAAITEPQTARVLIAGDAAPAADDDTRWQLALLPDYRNAAVAWYRIEFQGPPAAAADTMWMLYLPYLYGGGRFWLNGEPLAALPENNALMRVRWERPLLLPLPQNLLRAGLNVLHLRLPPAHQPSGINVPRISIGAQEELQPLFDRRLFVVRTVPLVTVAAGSVIGLFVLFIWLRRHEEVLYGLFGAAALLWAARTTTFVFDSMPVWLWPWWRLLYHATNGGFIVAMALFALRLAGWYRPGVALALVAYALLGPLLYALLLAVSPPLAEEVVGRWWAAGLIPIGLTVAVASAAAAFRQRTPGTLLIALAVGIAFFSGVHDYLVAWGSPLIEALLPRWSGHRIFLLHHGANVLLLVMGGLLTLRFVRSLHEVQEANRTLEARVAERESEIAQSYARIAELQREQATQEERQRIMQELHDGLGSQLFTSLMRAERGALDAPQAADALRASIDEMRVAIEALASDEQDFRTAFGNFRFRWEQRLHEAGVAAEWQLDLPDEVLRLPPHDALQLLRIAQEALTNVLKHARATRVKVLLRTRDGHLRLAVEDDGRGGAAGNGEAAPLQETGRGVANMRARALRLGGSLQMHSGAEGTRVAIDLRWPPQPTAAVPG